MKPLASERGFTLVEVLVAVIILTIGLLGTAGLTTGIIRGNHYSKNITSATAAAQTRLESVKSAGYSQAEAEDFPSDTVSMGGMRFTRTTTITDDSPADNMKTVTVTVTWTETNNTSRSVTLQTILAE
jgi:prepilin-type N-terminal cleavage/methylation domain-containing protein